MSIYEYNEEKHMRQTKEEGREEGRKEGRKEGREEGIRALIEVCRELGISEEITRTKLKEKYQLLEEQIAAYMQKYGK